MKIFKKLLEIILSPYSLFKRYIDNCTRGVSAYKYKAINSDGTTDTDYLCINEKIINNFFIMENKKLVSIKTNKYIKYKYRNINRVPISNKELVYFLVQLNSFIKAGNNLLSSVSLVIKKCKYKNLEKILRLVRYDLMCGNDLSDALGMQGNSFPKLLISVLKDNSTSLSNHLIEMEDYYRSIYLNEYNGIKLNIYKVFILPYILMVSMFILGYIIPKFYDLYKLYLDEDLVFLKGFKHFSKYDNFIFISFIILINIYFIIIFLYNTKSFKNSLQKISMKIFKSTIDKEMVIFSRTMSLVIKYNLKEMSIINNITDNYNFNELLIASFNSYHNNHKISNVLSNNPYFPVRAIEMIKSGEGFDSLLLQINNTSNYFQNRLDKNKKLTMSIVGPLIIIMSALLFGSIIIIMLLQCLLIIK